MGIEELCLTITTLGQRNTCGFAPTQAPPQTLSMTLQLAMAPGQLLGGRGRGIKPVELLPPGNRSGRTSSPSVRSKPIPTFTSAKARAYLIPTKRFHWFKTGGRMATSIFWSMLKNSERRMMRVLSRFLLVSTQRHTTTLKWILTLPLVAATRFRFQPATIWITSLVGGSLQVRLAPELLWLVRLSASPGRIRKGFLQK